MTDADFTFTDYQPYDYPVFGPGSGEAIRLDDEALGFSDS